MSRKRNRKLRVLLCLLVVLRVVPWPAMLLLSIAAMLIFDRKTLLKADFMLLLTFVAFVFINNTIRLAITARRREIGIMRLLRVQKGQTLVLDCPVEHAWFARLCAEAAYDLGCREVVVDWHDTAIMRQKFLRAADEVFDEFPAWRTRFLTDYAEAGAASLRIGGSDPEALRGVAPERLTQLRGVIEKFKETF